MDYNFKKRARMGYMIDPPNISTGRDRYLPLSVLYGDGTSVVSDKLSDSFTFHLPKHSVMNSLSNRDFLTIVSGYDNAYKTNNGDRDYLLSTGSIIELESYNNSTKPKWKAIIKPILTVSFLISDYELILAYMKGERNIPNNLLTVFVDIDYDKGETASVIQYVVKDLIDNGLNVERRSPERMMNMISSPKVDLPQMKEENHREIYKTVLSGDAIARELVRLKSRNPY